MAFLKTYYKRELIASAIYFLVFVWFIDWSLTLIMAAILFLLNLGIDYFRKELRERRMYR
jgi:hypothetical protein